MTKVFVDAAMSIDGFWADRDRQSVFPIDDMHRSGLIKELVDRTGAVVMSRRSFEMADDPDWFVGNYELQVPLHVFTDAPPSKRPKEGGGVTFSFYEDFAGALAGARIAAHGRDVAIIGERSAVEAAIAADAVDEIYLRIVPKICGGGEPLMVLADMRREFNIQQVTETSHAVHIRLATARTASP